MYDGGDVAKDTFKTDKPEKKKCGKGEFRFCPLSRTPYLAEREANSIRCYMYLMILLHCGFAFLGIWWYNRPLNLVLDLLFAWLACQSCCTLKPGFVYIYMCCLVFGVIYNLYALT